MASKNYQVKDVARLAAVTVRTLHHYDEIGLLVPSGRSEAGYRLYGDDDLLRLQQIVIGRELGFSLEEIRRLLDDPGIDRREVLRRQRRELERRLHTTRAMIASVDRALAALDGETTMEPEHLFDGFSPELREEARARWGGTDAYREASRRTQRYSKDDWARIRAEDAELLRALATKLALGVAADDGGVTELAERHRLHIERWYYPCDHGMHVGLAEMYLSDERFAAHFEAHGAGLTAYLAQAIRANAAREQP